MKSQGNLDRNGENKTSRREYYEQLAGMVDEMTPEVVYQSVQATPRPSTNVPACADELLQELGVRSCLEESWLLGIWTGRVLKRTEENVWGRNINPHTISEVAAKFGISSSRLMDLRRGAAINREDTQRNKMLKAEKKEEAEGKTPNRIPCSLP